MIIRTQQATYFRSAMQYQLSLLLGLIGLAAMLPLGEAGVSMILSFNNTTKIPENCPDRLINETAAFIPTDTCVTVASDFMKKRDDPAAIRITCAAGNMEIRAFSDTSCSSLLTPKPLVMSVPEKKCYQPKEFVDPKAPVQMALYLDCSAPDAMPPFFRKNPFMLIDVLGMVNGAVAQLAALVPPFRQLLPNPNATLSPPTCPVNGDSLSNTRISLAMQPNDNMQCPPPFNPFPSPPHSNLVSRSTQSASALSAMYSVYHSLFGVFASMAPQNSAFHNLHQQVSKLSELGAATLFHLDAKMNANPTLAPPSQSSDIPPGFSLTWFYNLEFSAGAGAQMTLCLPTVQISRTGPPTFSFGPNRVSFDRATTCSISQLPYSLTVFTLNIPIPYQMLGNDAAPNNADAAPVPIGVIVASAVVAAAAIAGLIGFRKGYCSCGKEQSQAPAASSQSSSLNSDVSYVNLNTNNPVSE